MRIVCPSCSAAYEVPDSMLGGRKAVRCARCGDEWRPFEREPQIEPEPEIEPEQELTAPPPPPREQEIVTRLELERLPRPVPVEPQPYERRMTGGAMAIDRLMAAPQPAQRSNVALTLAWLGSVVAIIVLLYAAYAWRVEIMAAWPPSVRVYAVLGLAD
jgi:predicted Zn finger-like uncharacterized protein